MEDRGALGRFWKDQPHVIRAFLDRRPLFQKLAEEVAYMLAKGVEARATEYSHITHRAKTLQSFCDKLLRKGYKNPLSDVTDLAGVRIVYLYTSDHATIEEVIEDHFIVIERSDKVADSEAEQFGYGAIHYLVKLGKKASGARYDDLKDLVCEIQVRTILQDAWAIVAHHLSYTQETDVPKPLRRKLNALSGLFETADDQFNGIKEERANYSSAIAERIQKDSPGILKQEINLDNLVAYLHWKLPDREAASLAAASSLLRELDAAECHTIAQIDDAISRSMDAIRAYEENAPPSDEETGKYEAYAQVGVVRVALSLVDEDYLGKRRMSKQFKDEIRTYRHLLKG
ncbi:MAG: hypothetical protein AMJ91_02980 [candidate division Zixibacteria bacterium SM23_73_3]|nr:MAG: hypothetical protein AMJ91_02980 [candidate division Zixibacteria bacterium SM23_73_3]